MLVGARMVYYRLPSKLLTRTIREKDRPKERCKQEVEKNIKKSNRWKKYVKDKKK